jgi:VWFA-related protein
MNSLKLRLAAAVWMMTCAGPADLFGQQPFRTGIALVPIDVRVVDKQGKPVSGLTRDDFVITEDGVRQTITFFEQRLLSASPASTGPGILLPGPIPPTGVLEQKRRVFLIALERAWLPSVPFVGVEALTKFLRDRLTSSDYAAISAFGRITDLTNDHEALAQVIERLLLLQKSIDSRNTKSTEGRALLMVTSTPNIPGAEAINQALDAVFAPASAGTHSAPKHNGEFETVIYRIVDEMWASITRADSAFGTTGGGGGGGGRALGLNNMLKAVERRTANVIGALQYLQYIEGEKHLVYPFVLPSFLSFDSDENIAQIASDARVSIDFIKANGLEASGGPMGTVPYASFGRMFQEMSFKNVAAISGGQVFLDRNPGEAYAAIDESTRASYLVAYTPANPKLDGRHRKIKVEVKGLKDATVINRRSYLASETSEKFDPELYGARDRVLTVASWPGGLSDLGVKLSAENKGRGVDAAVRFDFRQIRSTPRDGRHLSKLEVAVFVTDKSERPVGSRWETLNLDLTDQTMARVMTNGFMHSVNVPTTGTAVFVKVVVYDYATGRAGSAVVRLD